MNPRAESCPPNLSVKAANAITSRSPAVANATLIQPNAALRGAARAFATHPTNLTSNSNGPIPNHGATAAATAAGILSHKRPNPASHKPSHTTKPVHPQNVPRSSPASSPSLMAAKAASASTSPQKSSAIGSIGRQKPLHAVNHKAFGLEDGAIHTKETEQPRGRRPRVNSTDSRSSESLSTQSALAATISHQSDVSPGTTSRSKPARLHSSELSAGLSAARAAASKLPTPVSDPVTNPIVGYMQRKAVDDINHIGLQAKEDPTSTTAESAASSSMQLAIDRTQAMNGNRDEVPSTQISPGFSSYSTSGQMQSSVSPNLQSKDGTKSMAEWAWTAASSRAPSPTKIPPPLTTRQRSHSHSLFHHRTQSSHHSEISSSPGHVLKHTLRKHKSDDEDEENNLTKRGRRHFIRKHQHKHHEGDRKRWRDKITERERKRYEGVWAANRGLYTFWDSYGALVDTAKPFEERDTVLNLVVREVWERSRLPREILEEVWDLVAQENAMKLRRDEFVVGMWLIDQRLKGRKLPVRVSPSVWASARHTLKIRAKT